MKSLFTLFVFIGLSYTAYAQTPQILYLDNASFEGVPGKGNIPSGWIAFKGNPSTEPIPPNTNLPTDGKTYIVLESSYPAKQDAIGQKLPYPLDSGKTYTFSFDLSSPYQSEAENVGAALEIGGTPAIGDPGEIYWNSGVFTYLGWRRTNVVFTPTRTINYIVFSAGLVSSGPPGGTNSSGTFPVLVDNLSTLVPTFLLTLDAVNACPGIHNGMATANPPDDGDAYTYLWQPGGYTTASIAGIPAGFYQVIARSATKGLSATQTIEVKTSDIKLDVKSTPVTCHGKDDAQIDVSASGGIEPYIYQLNGSDVFKSISAGNYNLTVTDSVGCTARETIVITEPEKLSLEKATVKEIPCSDAVNGQIILTPSGGVAPYKYIIPNRTATQDSIFTKLGVGTYHCYITDANNCTVDSSIIIRRQQKICAVFVPSAFSPNRDGINDVFRVKVQDEVTDFRLAVYGRWGQVIFETKDPEEGWNGKLGNTPLPPGSYIWSVTYTDNKQQLIKQQGNLNLIL